MSEDRGIPPVRQARYKITSIKSAGRKSVAEPPAEDGLRCGTENSVNSNRVAESQVGSEARGGQGETCVKSDVLQADQVREEATVFDRSRPERSIYRRTWSSLGDHPLFGQSDIFGTDYGQAPERRHRRSLSISEAVRREDFVTLPNINLCAKGVFSPMDDDFGVDGEGSNEKRRLVCEQEEPETEPSSKEHPKRAHSEPPRRRKLGVSDTPPPGEDISTPPILMSTPKSEETSRSETPSRSIKIIEKKNKGHGKQPHTPDLNQPSASPRPPRSPRREETAEAKGTSAKPHESYRLDSKIGSPPLPRPTPFGVRVKGAKKGKPRARTLSENQSPSPRRRSGSVCEPPVSAPCHELPRTRSKSHTNLSTSKTKQSQKSPHFRWPSCNKPCSKKKFPYDRCWGSGMKRFDARKNFFGSLAQAFGDQLHCIAYRNRTLLPFPGMAGLYVPDIGLDCLFYPAVTDEDDNDDTDVSFGRSPRSKDKSSWDVNETEEGQFYSADNSAISGGPSSQSAGRSGASKTSKRGAAASSGSKRNDGGNRSKRSDEGNRGKRSDERNRSKRSDEGSRNKSSDEGNRQQLDSVDTTVPEEPCVANGDRLTSLEEVHSESGRSVSAAESASKRSQAGSVESGSRKSLPEHPIHDSVSDKIPVTQDDESKKTSVCPTIESHSMEHLEIPDKMSRISVHAAESDKVSTLPDERTGDWPTPTESRSYKSLAKTKSESSKNLDRSEKEEVKSLAELKQDVEGPTEKARASPVIDTREKLSTQQEPTAEGKEKTKCEEGVIRSPEAGDELAITMKCAESTSCDYCTSDTFFQVCATVRSPGNVLTVNLEEVNNAGVYKDCMPDEISPSKQMCGQMDTLNLQIRDCMGGDATMEELKPTSTESRLSTPKNEDTATPQPREDPEIIDNEEEDEQQKNTPSASSKSERMQKSRTFQEESERGEISSHSSRRGRVKGERHSDQDHNIQDAASKHSTTPDCSSMQEMETRLDDSENTESSVVYDELPCEFRRPESGRKSSRRPHKGMESGYPQTDEIIRRSGQRYRSSHQSSEFLRGISTEKLERMERRTTSERRRHRPRDVDEEYEESYEPDPRHQRSRDQWSHDGKSKRGSRWSSAAYGEQPYIPGYDEYPYGRQVRPAHRKHYDDGQEEEIYYSPRSVRDRKRSRHSGQVHGRRSGNVGPVECSRYPQTGYGISIRSHSGGESVSSVTECDTTEDGSTHRIVKCVPSPDRLRSMCPDLSIRRDRYKPGDHSEHWSREDQSKASREDEGQIRSSGSIPFQDTDTIEPEEEGGADAASPETIDQKEESVQGSAVSTSALQQSAVWDEEDEDERNQSDTVPAETELSQKRLSKEIDTPSRPLSRTRTSSFSHGEVQMSDKANSNSGSAEMMGEVDVLSGLEQPTDGHRKSRQAVQRNQRYIQCPDGQIRKIRGRITFRSTECYGQTGPALAIQSGTMNMIASPESVKVMYGQTGEEIDSLSNESSSVTSARGQNTVSSCPYSNDSHTQNYETFLSDSCMERYEHERKNIKERQRRYSQLCHTLSTQNPHEDSRHEYASAQSTYACNQRGLSGKVLMNVREHDRSGSHSKPLRMPDEEDKRMVRNAHKTDYRSRSNSARRISGLHAGEIDPFGQVIIPEQPLQVQQKCSMWAYTDHMLGSRQTSKGNQLPAPDTSLPQFRHDNCQPEKLCYIEEKQLVESTLVTHKIHPISASHVRYSSQQSPTRSLIPAAKMDSPIFSFEDQCGSRGEYKVKDDRHRYKRQARAEITNRSRVAGSLGFVTGDSSDHISSSSTATVRRRSSSRADTHYTSGPYSIDSDSASSRPDSVCSENKNFSSNVERDRNSSSGPVDAMTSDYAYHCGMIDILRLLDNDSMSLSSRSDVDTVRKGTTAINDRFENVMEPLPTQSISRHNDEAFEIIRQNSLRALVYAATMSSAWKAMQALRKDEDLQQWINQTCVQPLSPQTSPPLLMTPVESPELVLNFESAGICKSLPGHKSDISAVENNFSLEELVKKKISSRPVSSCTPLLSSQQGYFTDSKDEVSKATDTEITPVPNLGETKLAHLDVGSRSSCSDGVFTITSVRDTENEASICEPEFRKENVEVKNVTSEMSSDLPEVYFNCPESDELTVQTAHLDQQTKTCVRRIVVQKYNLGDDFSLKPLQISCPSSCPPKRETLDKSFLSGPGGIENKVSVLSKPTISLTKLASSISRLSGPAREMSNVSTDNQEMKSIPESYTPNASTTFMILQDNKSEERRLELSRVGELSPYPPMLDIDSFKTGSILMNTQADKDSLVTQSCHTLNQDVCGLKCAALETFEERVMENYGSKEEKSEQTAPISQAKPLHGDTVSSLEDRQCKISNDHGDEEVAVGVMTHDKIPSWCNTASNYWVSTESGLLGTVLDTYMGKEVGTCATNKPEENRIAVTLKDKSGIKERPITKNSSLSNQLDVPDLPKDWLSDMRLEHDYVKRIPGGECVSSPLRTSTKSKCKGSSPRRAGMDCKVPNRMTNSLCSKSAAPTPFDTHLIRSEQNHVATFPFPSDATFPSPSEYHSSRSGRRSKSSSSVYRPKENLSEREQLNQVKNRFDQETATLFHALVNGKLKVLYDRNQKRWTSPDLKRFSLFRGKNTVSERDVCVDPPLWPYSLRVREKSPLSSTTTTTRRKTTVSSQSFTSLPDTKSDGSVVEGDVLIMSLPNNFRRSAEDDTDGLIRTSKDKLIDWIREILPDIIEHKWRRHLLRGKDQFLLKASKKSNKNRNKLRLLLTKYMSPSSSYTTNNSASDEGPSRFICNSMNIDMSKEEAGLGRLTRGGKRVSRKDKHTPRTAIKRKSPGLKTHSPQAHTSRRYRRPGAVSETRRSSTSRNHSQLQPRPQSTPRKTAEKKSSAKQQMDSSPTKMKEKNLKSPPKPTALPSPCVGNLTEDGTVKKFTPTFGSSGVSRVAQSLKGLAKPSCEPSQRVQGHYQEHVSTNLCEDLENDSLTEFDTLESCLLTPIMEESHSKDYASTEKSESSDFDSFVIKCKIKLQDIGSNQEKKSAGRSTDILDTTTPAVDPFDQQGKFLFNQAMSESIKTRDNIVGLTHSEPALVTSPPKDLNITQPHCCAHDHPHEFICPHGNVYELHPDRVPHEIRYFNRYNSAETRAYDSGFIPRPPQREYFKSNFMRQEMQGGSNANAVTDDLPKRNEYELMRRYINSSVSVKRSSSPTRFTHRYTEEFNVNMNWKIPLGYDRFIPSPKKDNLLSMKRSYSHHHCNFSPSVSLPATSRMFSSLCPALNYNYMEPDYKSCYLQSAAVHFHDYFTNARLCKSAKQPGRVSSRSTTSLGHRWLTADSLNASPLVGDLARWNFNENANNGDDSSSSGEDHGRDLLDLSDRGQHEDLPSFFDSKYYPTEETVSLGGGHARADKPLFESGSSYKSDKHYLSLMDHVPYDESYCTCREHDCISYDYFQPSYLCNHVSHFAARNINGSGNMFGRNIGLNDDRYFSHRVIQDHIGDSDDDFTSATEDLSHFPSSSKKRPKLMRKNSQEMDDTCNHPESISYFMGDGPTGHFDAFEGIPKDDLLMGLSPMDEDLSSAYCSYKQKSSTCQRPQEAVASQMYSKDNKPREPDYESNVPAATGGQELDKPVGGLGGGSCCGQGDISTKHAYTQWYVDDGRVPQHGHSRSAIAPATTSRKETWSFPTSTRDIGGGEEVEEDDDDDDDDEGEAAEEDDEGDEDDDDDDDEEDDDDEVEDGEDDEDDDEEDDENEDEEEDVEDGNEGAEDLEDEEDTGRNKRAIVVTTGESISATANSLMAENICQNIGQLDIEMVKQANDLKVIGKDRKAPPELLSHGIARPRDVTQNKYFTSESKALVRAAGSHMAVTSNQQAIGDHVRSQKPSGATVEKHAHKKARHQQKFSLEQIKVPAIDKERVRFACDDSGDWAEIGRGSYGCVYLGLLDGIIEVAIKDFYESSSWDLVIHEARMLMFLQDTGITPKFYGLRRRFDVTKQPSEYCIIMEYFGDGRTLFNVMSEKMTLTGDEWLDIVGQLVAGLRLIHRKHVLINDLKADNILIDLSGGRKIIRYIDVGMATYKQGLTFQLPQDQMCKYNFLAPEVREGARTTTRSDIYSLGYMLEQMIRQSDSSLGGLKKLVSRCMEKNPARRPDIDDIVSQVHRFIASKASNPAPSSSPREQFLLTNSV